MEHLQYPIGKFEFGKSYTALDNQKHIEAIEHFPAKLKAIASQFTEEQLNKTYRPNGWTAKQVIHHLFDSHVNAYIRVKLALTETAPTVKPYAEALWADLEDGRHAPVASSIALIEALHQRWVYLLKTLTTEDFQRTYFHPEYKRTFQLNELLALYAWHGEHHYGHLKIILSN